MKIKDGEIIIDQQMIEQEVRASLRKTIEALLSLTYDNQNPIVPMVRAAIAKNAASIQSLLDDSVKGAFDSKTFRENVTAECNHKLAKCLIQKMEGEIEKRANDLRADPAFRARLTLAINEVVENLGK